MSSRQEYVTEGPQASPFTEVVQGPFMEWVVAVEGAAAVPCTRGVWQAAWTHQGPAGHSHHPVCPASSMRTAVNQVLVGPSVNPRCHGGRHSWFCGCWKSSTLDSSADPWCRGALGPLLLAAPASWGLAEGQAVQTPAQPSALTAIW